MISSISIGDRYLHTLLFANDQVVFAKDEEDANYMLRKLIVCDLGVRAKPRKKYMIIESKVEDI